MLKRSYRVSDLSTIPGETPTDASAMVTFSLSGIGQSSILELKSFDPCMTVRQMKRKLEPFAYQLYIKSAEHSDMSQEYKQQARNVHYYARTSSPTMQSPSSDYESENEVGLSGHQFLAGTDLFLNSMKLSIVKGDANEVSMKSDLEHIYTYNFKQDDKIKCIIDTSKLVAH